MATRYWNDGAADGDLTNAANWTGGVPGAGDIAIIDDGDTDITQNVNFSATDLAGFRVGPNFNASIGTSGSPLVLQVSGQAIIAGGKANTRIYISGAGTAIDELIVSRVGDGTTPGLLTLTGTITEIIHHNDPVAVTAGTITTYYQEAEGLVAGTCSLALSGGTITTLRRLAGLFTQTGGTVTTLYDECGGASITGGTNTNVECRGASATTVWTATAKTITSLKVWGGAIFQASGVGQVITASEVHESGKIDASDGDVTFTAAPVQYGSGIVLYPSGSSH